MSRRGRLPLRAGVARHADARRRRAPRARDPTDGRREGQRATDDSENRVLRQEGLGRVRYERLGGAEVHVHAGELKGE